MKILITGATGLIGSALADACIKEGHQVNYLTTRESAIVTEKNKKGFLWNPTKREIDEAAFDGVTAIVHLAGATIAKRWTNSYKKEILESRINTANLLHETLKTINHSVTRFISASGISIYPPCESK